MIERPDDEHPGEHLSAYVDGEIPETERARIGAHLSRCSDCRALAQDFRTLATAALREEIPPVPEGLQARIRAAIEKEPARGATQRRGAIASYSLGLAVAATVLLTLGLWALRRESAPAWPVPAPPVKDLEKDAAAPEALPHAPPASQSRANDDISAQLKALGYVGAEAGREELPGPAPADRRNSRQDAPGGVKPPPAAPEREKKDAALSPRAESRDRIAAGVPSQVTEPASEPPRSLAPLPHAKPESITADGEGSVATDARAQSAIAGARVVRRLVIEYPGYGVSIFDDGMIVLSAPEYRCAARRTGLDPDLRELFGLAASAAGKERASAGPAPPGVKVRLEEEPKPQGSAGNRALPAATSAEIGARFKVMLREKYLTFLEERCGEAPRTVRSD